MDSPGDLGITLRKLVEQHRQGMYQVLGLGTACPTIFDVETGMVAVARNVARFFGARAAVTARPAARGPAEFEAREKPAWQEARQTRRGGFRPGGSIASRMHRLERKVPWEKAILGQAKAFS